MKIKDLKSLIKECYKEVLKEYQTTTPSYDSQSKENTDVIKISKQDPQKQMKITSAQRAKQSYELYEDENVNEMARIPQLYKAGEMAKLPSKLADHPKVKKMIEFIEKNGPSSIIDIAKENGWRQQQLNPMVQPLIDAGILEPNGLRSEPKSSPKEKVLNKFSAEDPEEEVYNDDEETNKDGYDDIIGFADKYEKKPWEFRDTWNGENDIDLEDDTLDHIEIDEPSLDDIEKDLEDLPKFDEFEDEEDELFEEKDMFQYRAGLKK